MGYFCYCIPLKPYGIFLACFQFIVCLCKFLELFVTDMDPTFRTPDNVVGVILLIAGIFLIVGILQRNAEYILFYLMLLVICICTLFGGLGASVVYAQPLMVYLLVQLVLTLLLSYPMNILYMEMFYENQAERDEYNNNE